MTRCLAPNCNLEGEYEFLSQGFFPVTVALDEIHRFSLSWDGSNVTLGCDGNIISYNPTSQATVAGPPKGRKGIGTRVNEISNASEWAYVSAAFDNVLVLSTGYPLTVMKSGTGTGTVTSLPSGIDCGSDCGQGYPGGTKVTLTAIPGDGSSFAGWSGGGCSGTGTCAVTMDSVKSVTATFTINTYTVTASVSGGNGTVSPDSQTVNYNGTATMNIFPNPGYHIASITDNGSSVTIANPYLIYNVSAAHTIEVTFAIDTYTITASGRPQRRHLPLRGRFGQLWFQSNLQHHAGFRVPGGGRVSRCRVGGAADHIHFQQRNRTPHD